MLPEFSDAFADHAGAGLFKYSLDAPHRRSMEWATSLRPSRGLELKRVAVYGAATVVAV